VLRHLPPITDPRVLVGHATADDAAVYQLSDELALVQTVDVFPAVVDDPYDFGQVAAANALSDIYAMGATPLTALAIIGFPVAELPLAVMGEILVGGTAKAAEAGIAVIGGHSLEDKEPKYGLAVTGTVHPARIIRNSTARPGDLLVLTKPLGSGLLVTAAKRGLLPAEALRRVIAVMSTLNRAASEAMVAAGASAATDITGYGLLGHLGELTAASGVGARLQLEAIPVLPEVWEYAAQDLFPGGTRANHRHMAARVTYAPALTPAQQLVLCDAQTSGGLLIAIPPDRLERLLTELGAREVAAALIGACVEDPAGQIEVTE
jgi:selenide,water dikinase